MTDAASTIEIDRRAGRGVGASAPASRRAGAVVAGGACSLLLAAAALLALATSASAHGGGSGDYRSVVTSIEPSDLPISAVVRDRDDRLRIGNDGDEDLVVQGYVDEPYAKIGPGGVFVNENSAAFYANEERYGGTVPDDLPSDPDWVRRDEDGDHTFEYHDHRIHWMLKTLPPTVDRDDPEPQQVYEWEVPATYGDTEVVIRGRLDYVGGEAPGSSAWKIAAVGGGIFVVVLAIGWVATRRRRRPAEDA